MVLLIVWVCFLGSRCKSPGSGCSESRPHRGSAGLDAAPHLFTRDALLQNPSLISSEPRLAHQIMQRWQAAPAAAIVRCRCAGTCDGQPPDRDWTMSLGLGRIAPNMFPAKYSFDPRRAPDCINDYVVFGLNRVRTGQPGQPGGVQQPLHGHESGGSCTGATPTVLFAYNTSTLTAGRILTSTALSLDGKKIAFVESGNVSGNPFHFPCAHLGRLVPATVHRLRCRPFRRSATSQ